MAEYKSKILIIGSGPAGYTAGIYAARAGLSATIVSGPQPGGQLTITTDVENFPGFPTPVAGTQLMEDMRQQALKLGVEIVEDRITEVDFKRRPFECNSENHNLFVGDTVIIATGASAVGWGFPPRKNSAVSAFPAVPPVTAFSTADVTLPLSAAETRPLKRLSTSPILPTALPSFTAATVSAPIKSCRNV